MLRVDVTKQLGEFSLQVAFTSDGRVTGLFGSSGAGKTSLINIIAGLLRPDRGIITLDGDTLDELWPIKKKCPEWRLSKAIKIDEPGKIPQKLTGGVVDTDE